MDPNHPFSYQAMLNSPSSPINLQSNENQPISPCRDLALTYDDSTSIDTNYGFNTMYPAFGSQCAIEGEASAKPKKKSSKARQQCAIGLAASAIIPTKPTTARQGWTVEDDNTLVSAYLNTSKDSVKGTDRSSSSFWKDITSFYNEYKKGGGVRDDKSCKNRWHSINGQVNKFVGCFNQATQRKKSGEGDDDVLLMAHKLYESDMKKKFNLEHAWYMLRNDPKWMGLGEESANKRTRINVQGNYTSSSSAGNSSQPTTPGTPCTPTSGPSDPIDCGFTSPEPVRLRPMGVKAAKRKAKVKMPSVEEGAESAQHAAEMNEFNTSQKAMADAIKMAAQTQQLKMYQKLLAKDILSSREEELLNFLHANLFP